MPGGRFGVVWEISTFSVHFIISNPCSRTVYNQYGCCFRTLTTGIHTDIDRKRLVLSIFILLISARMLEREN